MIVQRVVTFLPDGVIGRSHITPHVRFTPESGHGRCIMACPLSANKRHMHRSKAVAIRSSRQRAA
jgi:hypothetical protein